MLRAQRIFRIVSVCLLFVFVLPMQVFANISSITSDSEDFTFTSQDGTPFDVSFKTDGTKMYMLGYDNDTVYQYSLSSAWDVSSASYDSVSFSVNGQESVPEGLFFKPDGTKMYVVGVVTDRVHR
ncbi:MAG: hypothetical protein P8J32_01740 [bacterium]|jgi:DNA-binding beta-propeller fold protein YncE|nr:hypothetical protein [bacterium]